MALPWHIPLEAVSSLKDKARPLQTTYQKHLCNLNVHEKPVEELQTGIMCEIGVQNKEPATIQRLIAAGMTVARLNMRDMEPDACGQLIQAIRQAVYNYSAELEYVYPLAVIVDVKEPDIVTGDLKAGPKATVELFQHGTVRLTIDNSWKESGTADCLYLNYEDISCLRPGDNIFIDSLAPGIIKLAVSKIGDDTIECNVITGGIIGSKMAVRIVNVPKEASHERGDSLQSFTCSDDNQQTFEHIEEQIAWAIGSDIDGLLVPNAQNKQDITHIKDLLGDKGKHILIFACVDTVLGLDNIDDLLAEADGVYLDRCVLSIDLPVEKIFIATKYILAKCNDAGKPVICKGVINEQIPTLCVTDLANLVLDGVDVVGLELHYDSPLKKYTLNYDSIKLAEQCLAAAGVICRQAENISWYPKIYGNISLTQSCLEEPSKGICVSAVELAMRSRAVVIICLTNSGRTAKILSHVKPICPIIAVTRTCHTARQLRFWRGVRAMHYFESAKGNWAIEVDARVHAALDYCKAKRLVRAGDPYVIVTGSKKGSGYCDAIRLLYASARDTVSVD